MDTLGNIFTIEIDGKPIAKPIDNGDELLQAKVGPDAAVFTLRGCRLESGDYVLGRSQIEDRSLLPKRVFWIKKGRTDVMAQPSFAVENDGALRIQFAGSYPSLWNDNVMAPLLDFEQKASAVVIKLQ